MNKTALKNFATNARNELMKKVEARAFKIGITEENIKKAQIETSDAIYIDGKQLSVTEKKQRDKLIQRIKEIGFKRVVEEVAYTWFNRFIALRFMEVNNYLPTKVRVLSSSNPDSPEPDIIKEALTVDLNLDKELIYQLKINNKTEELFKYLIIKQCNSLNKYLPFMFETIEDYKEILFPEGLLAKDSFLREMTDVTTIPESDWEQVEIIGWLYQYYISEEKDRVYKEKEKHKKEEIPYVTQLFTPSWIVQYMVQNSLGKYWVETHPDDYELVEKWNYYVDSTEKLNLYINKDLKVEDIKCLDPAMGSGHILVYMFDILYQIYNKCGYMERDIPRLIIENNLYGMDIDDRAYQLACFAIVMKAMQYNSRFLRSIEREGLKLNLVSIQETNELTKNDIVYISGERAGRHFDKTKDFIKQFEDAKIYGSLINCQEIDLDFMKHRLVAIQEKPTDDIFEVQARSKALELLPCLIKQTEIMMNKYDVLITNPPYISSGRMNNKLSEFLKKMYPDSKSDTCASFMEVSYYLKEHGYLAMVNQHSWMFLSSFEGLRKKILTNSSINSMVHLGPRAFEEIGGEVVQTTAFVLRKVEEKINTAVDFFRLVDFRDSKEKELMMIEAVKNRNADYRFSSEAKEFLKIPGYQIAYWLSNKSVFEGDKLSDHFFSGGRNKTHNNEKYVRFLWEINRNDSKWVLYANGGEFRKYYGNDIYVVDWSEEARSFYESHGGLCNPKFWNKEGITWNSIKSENPGFKIKKDNLQYSSASPTIFNEANRLDKNVLGFLNSKVSHYLLEILNPTLNTTVNYVLSLPYDNRINIDIVSELVEENINIARDDWDHLEISNDFKKHPFIEFRQGGNNSLSRIYQEWESYSLSQFDNFKKNEEELNKIFIDIYKLQNVLRPDVSTDEVTISIANEKQDVKSFISYSVGCMFGRYSLDEEGVVHAGGSFEQSKMKTFPADEDNILPILSGAYFEDDIVSRFIEFIKVTFGEETLEENLEFICHSLGKREEETTKETIRRYFLNDFYKDHLQMYKKRPIYWLFTSGKQKAFNCLIYMHRYDKTTLSRIRTDYLHELQIRLDAEKKSLLSIIEGDGTAKEISNAKKELKALDLKIEELKAYDELLHHMADMQIEIDLDDGVAVNYAKFNGLLAKLE